MDPQLKFVIWFHATWLTVALIIILILIVRKMKKRRQENFERRDN